MALLKGMLSTFLVAMNTVILCIPLFAIGLVRIVSPESLRNTLNRKLDHWIIDGWVGVNRLVIMGLRLTNIRTTWEGAEDLSTDRWYLVISNHRSWSDILLLQTALFHRIPPIKFFTKRELLWVPFVGVAMRMLGFPYVRRMSKTQISRNPELLGADRQATLEACKGFRAHPTTVLNFLEGTRYTTAKHARQNARFRHLLNPKVGGISYVLGGLKDRLHKLLDITIEYPYGTPTFWEFMQGRCPEVRIVVQCRDFPSKARDIANDVEQRKVLAPWIEKLWREKDQRLNRPELAV